MRYFFSPRASATLVLPYVQSSGTDVATSRDVEAGGPGDVSVAVSWDVLGSGAAGPEGDGPTTSHRFSLTAKLSAPTGSDAEGDAGGAFPSRYQPGSGVWVPAVSAYYECGLGRAVPGVGVSYTFSGGENSAGYEAPPSASLDVGALFLMGGSRARRLRASLRWQMSLEDEKLDGVPVAGSSGTAVSLVLEFAARIGGGTTLGLLADVVLSDERTAPGSETEAARTLGVLVSHSF